MRIYVHKSRNLCTLNVFLNEEGCTVVKECLNSVLPPPPLFERMRARQACFLQPTILPAVARAASADFAEREIRVKANQGRRTQWGDSR